ncbi:MAG: hypothetical protein IPO41_13215 [Acidobacteria bacterium]|nr:hypothetical protein [Acidobacteriota bacterium]MBK9529238.1 hypothetical protein [Acidobacteriota bacterium]MBP7474202.1 hypothetical protein [Pyrinomonadaceae bacterium]MBP9109652.1 hypothetical protein [Pyrinomonadaceae bacterium]
MATNFASDISHPRFVLGKSQLTFEHKFFLAFSAFIPVLTVIGYAQTYYLKPLFNTPPLPSGLVHLHALLMSAWIILFGVQAYLVSSKRIKLHISLGMLGISLATSMVIIGVLTGVAALKRGSTFPGYTPVEFAIIPLADMVVFPIIFAAAIYYRHDAASHKRLMLITMLNLIGPSIARLPLPFILDLGTFWFFGLPNLIAFVLVAGDTYRNGKLNRAFAAGVIFSFLSWPIRMIVARTEVWENFAGWMAS